MNNNSEWPDGLAEQVQAGLARLEQRTGRKLGDTNRPLLVSVRSGAVQSMPGMMDTILNLGISDESVPGVIAEFGNERFAYDCYRRFIQMYGEVVEGIEPHVFEDALTEIKAARGVALDTDLTADDLKELTATFKALANEALGGAWTSDPREQLNRAVNAVFASWMNPRAEVYRRANGISRNLGTAVNVQQMVFGNRGETSATGVCFSRNPSTGAKELYGEFLTNAQGEASSPASVPPASCRRWRRSYLRPSTSFLPRWTSSSSTTRTCRTWSSRSRIASSTCCRPATGSAPPRPR
jgi:pyruvate,orthophosphate dikinase